MLTQARSGRRVSLRKVIVIVVFSAVFVLGVIGQSARADQVLFKEDAPDFCQHNSNYDPDSGARFCVPTAVADGIVWLHDHGFDRLPDVTDEEDIVNELADLMYTDDPGSGTSMANAEAGLRDYLEEPGRYPGDVNVVSRGKYQDGNYPDAADWAWTGQQVALDDTCVVVVGGAYTRYKLPGAGEDWTPWARWGGHALFLVGYGDGADEGKSYTYDPYWNGDEVCTKTEEDPTLEEHLLSWQDTDSYYRIGDITSVDPPGGAPLGTLAEMEIRWDDALAYQIVPEPGMMALGLGGLAMLSRRKRR